MKRPLDKFSKVSNSYKKYRPEYPGFLYEHILALVPGRESCWDCGTGNGQVAKALSKHFKSVHASDISAEQIENAAKLDNIIYSIGRAETTDFKADQFDLITVAQAIHWFDLDAFQKEIKRVSKNNGVLAIWGYGLFRTSKKIDALIDDFYTNIIGHFWNEERKHIENSYESINFDYPQVYAKEDWYINVSWSLEQLQGYLNSWSGVENYKDKNNGSDPVPGLIKSLEHFWVDGKKRTIRFPIFLKAWKIEK